MSSFMHEATIRGRGPFPIDMLRYDCCFPKGPSDSSRIARTIQDDVREPMEIVVCKLAEHALPSSVWTKARWESFGWILVGWTKEQRRTAGQHVPKNVTQARVRKKKEDR